MSEAPRSIFESILPPEKREILARGESITVTPEEVSRFQAAYEQTQNQALPELKAAEFSHP
jgi:hypothetical protein